MRALIFLFIFSVSSFSFSQKKYDKTFKNIDDKKNYYSSIAQDIWSFAEMGYQEEKSSNLLKKILSEQGFNIKSGVANIPTAFIASYGKGFPIIAILGLNPHCETINKFSEEKKIIVPAIKELKNKKINIKGPFSADTFFSNQNINNFDVAVGMYHDQVITPMKTIFNFNAINLTLGLPFLRVSPDHGPNEIMLGKNKSNSKSLLYCINFLENIK